MTPTPSTTNNAPTRLSRTSAWVAFAIALLITAQGAFLLILGFDESNFAEAAGIEWVQFEADNPSVAEHLSQGGDARIFAITSLGLGLQTALLLYLAIKKKRHTPLSLLYILPAVVVGWGVILLPTSQSTIAIPSLILGVLMAAATRLASSTLGAPHPAP